MKEPIFPLPIVARVSRRYMDLGTDSLPSPLGILQARDGCMHDFTAAPKASTQGHPSVRPAFFNTSTNLSSSLNGTSGMSCLKYADI